MTKISGLSVSWRMQLTTMSCSASSSASGSPGGEAGASAPRRTARRPPTVRALGQHRHVADPERRQRPHRPARGRAEADHRGAQAAAVVAGRAEQLQRVQDRAVAGELVVLVEDVDAEVALLGPVVHRLEGDQRQPALDRELGHARVLHAVRPAPDDLARAQRLEVVGQRLGQDDHVALREQLLARAQAADERLEVVVGEAEALAVAAARGRAGGARRGLIRSMCAGWIASRRSSCFREVATTPALRRSTGDESRLRGMDELIPIGTVESPLTDRATAPKQGDEGAPDAAVVLRPGAAGGLDGIRPGDALIVLTWLDRARRDVLRVHPRGDLANPEQGVFNTRSPDRPNPIGLHVVKILAIDGHRVRVRNLEALDGTPVLDLKPVLRRRGALRWRSSVSCSPAAPPTGGRRWRASWPTSSASSRRPPAASAPTCSRCPTAPSSPSPARARWARPRARSASSSPTSRQPSRSCGPPGVEVDAPAANDRHRYIHFRAPDGKLYELVEER